jgi:hypothetical protein
MSILRQRRSKAGALVTTGLTFELFLYYTYLDTGMTHHALTYIFVQF